MRCGRSKFGPAVQVGLNLAARERAAAEQAGIDGLPAVRAGVVLERREVVADSGSRSSGSRCSCPRPPTDSRSACRPGTPRPCSCAWPNPTLATTRFKVPSALNERSVVDEVAPLALDVPHRARQRPANLPLGADGELVQVPRRHGCVRLEVVRARLRPAAEDVRGPVPDVGVVVLLLRDVGKRIREALEHAVVEPAVRGEDERLGSPRSAA